MSLRKNKDLENVIVFILCAGEGTRIKDFQKDGPKPLIKLKRENNRSILEVLLLHLFQEGIKKIVITKGHKKDQISKFITQFRRKKGLSSDQLTAVYARLYKRGPLFSFLSVLEDKSIDIENKHLIILPGDTIFESELLSQIFTTFKLLLTQFPNNPFTFFRKIKVSALISKHKNALKDVKKLISIAEIEEKTSYIALKKIDQVDLNAYNPNDILYQIIPFFILNHNFIDKTQNYHMDDLVSTLREAINYSITNNLTIYAVEIKTDSDFFDIDTAEDLIYFEKKKKREQ